MPFAIELYLDARTEALLRGVWQALADAGVSRSMLGEGFSPHITLGIADQLDSARLWPDLQELARQTCPLPVALTHIGVFPNAEGVVFFGATPSRPLLELHERFNLIFDRYAVQPWEYYRVGAWVPHCTVAFGLSQEGVSRAVALCMQTRLPVPAEVDGIGVAEVVPGRSARTLFAHRLDPDGG
ncbi:MAG: 2'-5' RNA ligase family protein [Chloroflexota bacterium]